MTIDLKTVNDHPAALLLAKANGLGPVKGEPWAQATVLLENHERKHGVTFAALDNEALAAVREAYDVAGQSHNVSGLSDLMSAVSDLLGLE